MNIRNLFSILVVICMLVFVAASNSSPPNNLAVNSVYMVNSGVTSDVTDQINNMVINGAIDWMNLENSTYIDVGVCQNQNNNLNDQTMLNNCALQAISSQEVLSNVLLANNTVNLTNKKEAAQFEPQLVVNDVSNLFVNPVNINAHMQNYAQEVPYNSRAENVVFMNDSGQRFM